jgi:hypothetical protein
VGPLCPGSWVEGREAVSVMAFLVPDDYSPADLARLRACGTHPDLLHNFKVGSDEVKEFRCGICDRPCSPDWWDTREDPPVPLCAKCRKWSKENGI